MQIARVVAGLLVALTLCPACGCLISGSHTRVIRQDEPLRHVSFESPYAQQVFQTTALSEQQRLKLSSEASLGIPLLLGVSYRSALSPNAFYNDCVARCDVDRDGMISDQEALVLTGSEPPLTARLEQPPAARTAGSVNPR